MTEKAQGKKLILHPFVSPKMQDTHKCKPARHQKHHHLVLIHLPKIHLTEIKAIIIFILEIFRTLQ